MIHLGDITKIDWLTVAPVDVVTGGSPCQDLSVAGKRAGLAGERSGLYMEQIRCVKELRAADERRGRTAQFIRPRFMVWENVPGAFSSNKGEDFRAVLEEAVKIAKLEIPAIPVPEGGWPKSGCLMGLGTSAPFSVAWRVHDAQFWGVAQRRRRIALVCDFGGLSAPEILFERKGVPWYHQESGAQREKTAGSVGASVESTSVCYGFSPSTGATMQGGVGGVNFQKEIAPTQRAGQVDGVLCYNKWDSQSARIYSPYGVWHSLNANENGGQSRDGVCIPINTMVATKTDPETRTTLGIGKNGDSQFTISSSHSHAVCAGFSFGQSAKAGSIGYQEEKAPTLRGGEGGNQKPCVYDARRNGDGNTVCTLTGDHQNRVTDYTALCIGNGQANQSVDDKAGALNCMHDQQAVITGAIVRRLTPLECERLQNFPDGWTDIGEWTDSKGKKHKPADTPRYKALGNSIALPFWQWLLRRIAAQYVGTPTLGSLFDGIGGFPLCWQRAGGIALWASEIEEFPIAVTKKRFESASDAPCVR